MEPSTNFPSVSAQKREGNRKKLKHVLVYDKIYEQIQSGFYPTGAQLPSETTLAKTMGVSRMTLRKALALFVEDGVIKNVPGVGHFVCSKEPSGRESKECPHKMHPIYAYSTTLPDDTEFAFRIEPPTPFICNALQHYTSAVVIADRWYKKQDRAFAYSLSFLPMETITEKEIHLEESEALLSYLEEHCYQEMHTCHRTCSYSTAGNFSADAYALSQQDSFLLIQETLYDESGKVFLSNKHYIPSELFLLELKLP